MADNNQDMEKLVVELTERMRSSFFGKYRGIVQKIEDDGQGSLGRIIAKVPDVYGDKDSPWALPSVPFAGKNHGLVVFPEVNDGVWIEFEAGDPARPIWSGSWWSKNEIPKPAGKTTRVLATSTGNKVILDDKKNEIKIIHSGGGEIAMSDNEIVLKIGGTKIVLSSKGVNINDGALEVK